MDDVRAEARKTGATLTIEEILADREPTVGERACEPNQCHSARAKRSTERSEGVR